MQYGGRLSQLSLGETMQFCGDILDLRNKIIYIIWGENMFLSKSIDYLLENAGDVIKYRLRKEILKDLSKTEEETLLEKILQTPYYKLVESYVKPNGYIGIGMHSGDKFKETPLQDGEVAARLLSNYAIPKESPIIRNFISALRNKDVIEDEFSYCNPEITRFENRFLGLNNGGGLMVLIYACQVLLGYGDDNEVKPFVEVSYRAFERILQINSLEDITIYDPKSKKKYNYPYIEQDEYFPCQYHLETLAYTNSWRSKESIDTMTDAMNHLCKIMKDDNNMHVKIGSRYYAPLWAYVRPFKPFTTKATFDVALRKTLTHLAMVGGTKIDVVKQSADIIKEALANDGILRVEFEGQYQKKRFKDNMKFPGPYSEISLEANHKTDTAVWCELTFWAVQLLSLLDDYNYEIES